MPNLSTYSTIKEKVLKYQKDYELETESLAFIWLCLENILGLNDAEITDSITDGSNDGGIDAVYINEREVHIFTFKYACDFMNVKRNFPETDLVKFQATIDRIQNKSLLESDVNSMLWSKVKEIWDLYEEGSLTLKFHICSNKEKPVVDAKRRFEQALISYRLVTFNYYNQEDLISKILEKKYKKIDGEMTFVDKQYFERSDGPLKGIVATVAASDIINLVRNPTESSKINEDAFNENVRVYLKLKNRINRGIYDTALSEENYEFWYLNNGITIVCEECDYTPNQRSPKARLTNLQIVNGGQTTHALFEAYLQDSDKLDNVLLIVRICETKKDYRISERISETTNSQTPIRTRDLHSNDGIQRKLEEQFIQLGYYYERKKNQHQDKEKSKRLDNELLGQIYLAYYLNKPSEAKNQKRTVFDDMYDDIFNEESITAKKMLQPYYLYVPLESRKKEIQRKLRKKEDVPDNEAFVSRATFHILNAIKIIAEHKSLNVDEQTDSKLAINLAIEYIYEVVKKEQKENPETYTHDKFFKAIPTSEEIRSHIESKFSDN